MACSTPLTSVMTWRPYPDAVTWQSCVDGQTAAQSRVALNASLPLTGVNAIARSIIPSVRTSLTTARSTGCRQMLSMLLHTQGEEGERRLTALLSGCDMRRRSDAGCLPRSTLV